MDHDRLAIEFAKLKARVEPMLDDYEEMKRRAAAYEEIQTTNSTPYGVTRDG